MKENLARKEEYPRRGLNRMEQSTVSVSKGCFVFKNGLRPSKTARNASKSAASSLLSGEYKSQRWYRAYSQLWQQINGMQCKRQTDGYRQTMDYLIRFVQQSYAAQLATSNSGDKLNLPTTALLTGINQPDHFGLFKAFADDIHYDGQSLVAIIQSRDCPNMKATIETMVLALMDSAATDVSICFYCFFFKFILSSLRRGQNSTAEDKDERRMRRSQYTMAVLKAWYGREFASYYRKPKLVVIIPDFENFQRDILQQFILLLAHNCEVLPLVLVLGVATDLATLHRTLSFSDTARLSLQVFQSPPSSQSLNQILDEILLTPKCPFTLSHKVYALLTDIFLYYDLSINSFMTGFKVYNTFFF